MSAFKYMLLAVVAANIILHGLGFFLMIKSHKGSNRTVQHLYITNLSASELLKNMASLFEGIVMTFYGKAEWQLLYIARATNCFAYSAYTFAMLFLTVDRFLTATAGERYTLFWNVKRTKVLIFIKLAIHFYKSII